MNLLEPVLEYPHLPKVVVNAIKNELGDYFNVLNEEIKKKQFTPVSSESNLSGHKTIFECDTTRIIKQTTEGKVWLEVHSSDNERFDFPDGFFKYWTLKGEKTVELSIDWVLKDGIPDFQKGKTLRITHKTPLNNITQLDFFVHNLSQSNGLWIEIYKQFEEIYDSSMESPKITNFPSLKNNVFSYAQYFSPNGENTAAIVKVGKKLNGLLETSLISSFNKQTKNRYQNDFDWNFCNKSKVMDFDLNGGKVTFSKNLNMKKILKEITRFE